MTVSAVTRSSSPCRAGAVNPPAITVPGSVAQIRNSYHGSASSGRGIPNTSHGTASSKIGAPGVTASATRWMSVSLRMRSGVALYVCAILGAGVLVLPGQAASLAGPASLLAWGFSALAGLPLAFTFAALASRFRTRAESRPTPRARSVPGPAV